MDHKVHTKLASSLRTGCIAEDGSRKWIAQYYKHLHQIPYNLSSWYKHKALPGQ